MKKDSRIHHHQSGSHEHSDSSNQAHGSHDEVHHSHICPPHQSDHNDGHHHHDRHSKKAVLIDQLYRDLFLSLAAHHARHWNHKGEEHASAHAVHDFFIVKICPKPADWVEHFAAQPYSYILEAFKNFLKDVYRKEKRYNEIKEEYKHTVGHTSDPRVWEEEEADHLRKKIAHHLSTDHLMVFDHMMAGYRPIDVERDLGLRNSRRYVREVREFVRSQGHG